MLSLGGMLAVTASVWPAACGSDESPKPTVPLARAPYTPQASVRTTTRLYVQLLLRNREPLGVVNPHTGALRLADLPTSPGDPPDRLHWTGGRLVFYGSSDISAVSRDLKGPPQKLGDGSYFLPSATRGRVWLLSTSWRDRKAEVAEVNVHGRLVSRSRLRTPCRASASIIAAASGALLCQRASGLTAFDPATGRAIMQITGPFPLATAGPLVASCGTRSRKCTSRTSARGGIGRSAPSTRSASWRATTAPSRRTAPCSPSQPSTGTAESP